MYHHDRHHRISPIELLVLRVLKDKPLYGNEIINELQKEFSGTSFNAQSGTIYPILRKFKENSWISEESGEQYKRKYNLTEEGRRKLENVMNNDMFDGFMMFYHKFSDLFTNFSEDPSNIRNIIFLKKEIRRLEKRKEFIEETLSKISNRIEEKKKKLKEIEKNVEYFNIPIE